MVKKLLIVLLIISCFFFKEVKAKTYYSDYSDFSSYSENIIDSSDLVDMESKRMYHAYKVEEKSILSDDLSLDIETHREDAIFGDIVDFYELDPNKRYESCYQYTYNDLKDYNYFVLESTISDITIKSIKFYNEEEDKLVNEIGSFILRKGDMYVFKIFNGEIVPMSELKLVVEIEKSKKDFEVYLYVDNDSFPFDGLTMVGEYSASLYVYLTELVFDNFENNDELYYEDIEVQLCGSVKGRVLYKDELYRNYEIPSFKCVQYNDYLDLYTDIESDEYLLDYDDYKDYYRFRKRDKVDIKDDVVITDYYFKVEDLINYSSIPVDSIDIVSDIDLTKNGEYKIVYILPFTKAEDTITVDIKENYINLIKSEEEIIQNLEEKIDESIYKVDKKNQEIKEVISTLSDEISSLTKEVETYKKEESIKEEIKEPIKEDNHLKQSISLIGLIILLLISLTVSNYVKKEKNDK